MFTRNATRNIFCCYVCNDTAYHLHLSSVFAVEWGFCAFVRRAVNTTFFLGTVNNTSREEGWCSNVYSFIDRER